MFRSLRRVLRRKKRKSKPLAEQDLRPASETVELISVHIPKTAGTAFWRYLTGVFDYRRIFLDYEDKPLHPGKPFQQDFRAWRQQNDNTPHKVLAGSQVVHGHFWGGKYDIHFSDVPKVTWLRDPVRRVISHYFYWKTQPPMDHALHRIFRDKNMSLMEFAAIPEMRNIVANAFLRECDLNTFDFIGIQEFFDEDIRLLGNMLGWPAVEVPVENKGPHGAAEKIDEDTRRKLRQLNQDDVDLYQTALRMREKRLPTRSVRGKEKLTAM